MGFMDKVKDFAQSSAKSVSDTSKKMSEKSRVKKEINTLEAGINSAYFEMGKKYFELNSDEPAPDFAGYVKTIKDNNAKLEKFRLLLASLEDKQPCSSCGGEVLRTQKFCDKCGAKVVFPEAPIIEGFNDGSIAEGQIIEAAAVCPNCGEAVSAGHVFCEKCGTKLG